MANQPIFVAAWRQDAATLRAARGSAPQAILTPGANGTRIHAIALANDGDAAALIEFGTYDVIAEDVTVDVAPGSAPSSDPFTITRRAGAWPALEADIVLTLAGGEAAHRGDYRLNARTDTVLTLENTPGNTIATAAGSVVTLYAWRSTWSLTVPARAGYDGEPAASGLDPSQMPWLDAAGDRWLLVTETLAARLPQNAAEAVTGNVHLTLFAGDY